ncbi:hypothetical protein [Streptomyces roseolilacinus]|uniref:hypothetical protein n=1 Tax=Streptomyces roseolilacinus TaxID=66904 RepID=UPI00381612C9
MLTIRFGAHTAVLPRDADTAADGDVRLVSDGTNRRLPAGSTAAPEPARERPHPLPRSMVAHAPWDRRPAVRHQAVRADPLPGPGSLAEPVAVRRV